MRRNLRSLVVPAALLLASAGRSAALGQKSGGILRFPCDGSASMSKRKGDTMMVNGNYNTWRLEDAWLYR